MQVSIITAVRNSASTVAHTLNSVARQDYPNIEHIVVDGASTDGTLDVIRNHSERVAHLLSEPDDGIYDAFNKGLSLAKGNVIAYLNAGDSYLNNGVVTEIVEAFTEGDVEAVFGDLLIVYAKERERVLRHYRSKRFRPERLPFGFMPAHPTMFLRRTVYERVGGYDATFKNAGDFEFCVRAFLLSPTRFLHLPRPIVRMPTGGLSNSGWKSKWTNTREMRRACLNHGISTSYMKLLLRLPVKAMEMVPLFHSKPSGSVEELL